MIEPIRHLSVFQPAKFGDIPVHIVGCGAVGSRIAMSIAKLGIMNIHLWDFDKVEEHNIANQIFEVQDIGQPKVYATLRHIERAVGKINYRLDPQVTAHNEPVTNTTQLNGIVFLLTDTMKSRKEIWAGAIKYKMGVLLMIETRMGADQGRIYVVDPISPSHIEEYEQTLYSDEDAEVSACGTSISVGPTAEAISGIAVWQLIRFVNKKPLDNEILFYSDPPTFVNKSFA